MANDLRARPWVIDTPGATVLWKSWIKAENIEFSGYTAGDVDNAVVTDMNGREIVQFDGAVDKSPQFSTKVEWFQGLIVPTLTSGKIKIYIK